MSDPIFCGACKEGQHLACTIIGCDCDCEGDPANLEHYCKWHSDEDDCPNCGECTECGMCECGIDESDDFYDDGEDDTMKDGYA